MSEEYRIPTHRVRAELLLAGQGTIRADLFLGEHTERNVGRERPLDLLNGSKAYIPLGHPERGSILVRRRAVLMASLSADEALRSDPAAEELLSETRIEETDAREVHVELLLEDGTEISGSITYVRPPGERRLQDFLNTSETFFRISDGDTLHLVNGERTVRISADPD